MIGCEAPLLAAREMPYRSVWAREDRRVRGDKKPHSVSERRKWGPKWGRRKGVKIIKAKPQEKCRVSRLYCEKSITNRAGEKETANESTSYFKAIGR